MLLQTLLPMKLILTSKLLQTLHLIIHQLELHLISLKNLQFIKKLHPNNLLSILLLPQTILQKHSPL